MLPGFFKASAYRSGQLYGSYGSFASDALLAPDTRGAILAAGFDLYGSTFNPGAVVPALPINGGIGEPHCHPHCWCSSSTDSPTGCMRSCLTFECDINDVGPCSGCTRPCQGGTFCSGVCTNTQFDPRNCGRCGNVCPPNQSCQNGTCTCAPPSAVCNGVCTNLQTDSHNCGVCGFDCAQLGGCCADGVCISPAPICNGVCTNVTTDVNNCGFCGNTCTGQMPACCFGQCSDLINDNSNCGSCGNACTSGICCNGSCGGTLCGPGCCASGTFCCGGKTCCPNGHFCFGPFGWCF